MSAIRRIYVYLLSFVGLLMLSGAVSNLGRVIVELVASSVVAEYLREEVSRWGAAALVGLPVWLVHWSWAQRLASQSPDERSSTLRRLYLYAVVGVATGGIAVGADASIGAATRLAWLDAVRPLPQVGVAVVVWVFHWRIAAADRDGVGEERGSATLRRWYVYAFALIGWVVLLNGATNLLADVWRTLAGQPAVGIPPGVPDAVVGVGLWAWHWAVLGGRFREADRVATLRSVYLFLSLAIVVAASLSGLSQLLYYGLGRTLGVDRPGGVGGSLMLAAAGPVSMSAMSGAGWAYARSAIGAQAMVARRQQSVRRLYTYLVALIALAGLATGVGGLLWLVGDALTNPAATAAGDWWRDRVALFATLALVSLPVWAVHWRPTARVSADEARSLSRRLYMYLALIAGSLTLLFSLASLAYRLLRLALGAPAEPSLLTETTHDLADTLVGAVVSVSHWRALGGAVMVSAFQPESARPVSAFHPAAGAAAAAEAVVRLRAADTATLQLALTSLRDRVLEVEVLSGPESPERTSPPAG